MNMHTSGLRRWVLLFVQAEASSAACGSAQDRMGVRRISKITGSIVQLGRLRGDPWAAPAPGWPEGSDAFTSTCLRGPLPGLSQPALARALGALCSTKRRTRNKPATLPRVPPRTRRTGATTRSPSRRGTTRPPRVSIPFASGAHSDALVATRGVLFNQA